VRVVCLGPESFPSTPIKRNLKGFVGGESTDKIHSFDQEFFTQGEGRIQRGGTWGSTHELYHRGQWWKKIKVRYVTRIRINVWGSSFESKSLEITI